MTKTEKLLSFKHSEKTRAEYVMSFKRAMKDKSNKLYAEQLLHDYSVQLNKLDKQ